MTSIKAKAFLVSRALFLKTKKKPISVHGTIGIIPEIILDLDDFNGAEMHVLDEGQEFEDKKPFVGFVH